MTLEAYRDQLSREQNGALEGLGTPWKVPDSVRAKVGPDGRLLPFEGDTMVFRLAPEELDWLDALRARLVEGLEELFAEPLRKLDLHLTLHDLSVPSSDENQAAARQVRLEPGTVELELLRVFPCLNISVLAGFAPVTPEDFRRAMGWHQAYEEVVPLHSLFRPHVTLAYFRPRAYHESEVARLSQRLASVQTAGRLRLDLSRLFYQRFTDMNHFQDIFRCLPHHGLNMVQDGGR